MKNLLIFICTIYFLIYDINSDSIMLLNGKQLDRKALIEKYSHYLGMVVRCSYDHLNITVAMLCTATEMGVFIYHNLLLTNFAWDTTQLQYIQQTGRKHSYRHYIKVATTPSKEHKEYSTNYTQVTYIDDWRHLLNNYVYKVPTLEDHLKKMSFKQLAIVIGHAPIRMKNKEPIDYIELPKHKLRIKKTRECFMITWDIPKLRLIPNLYIVKVVITSVLSNNKTSFDQLNTTVWIRTLENISTTEGTPFGGEPVICRGELYCIVSRAMNFLSKEIPKDHYLCTTLYDNLKWIKGEMFKYGIIPETYDIKPKCSIYSKYMGMVVRCHARFREIRDPFSSHICEVHEIGVLIYNNLILTNYAWDRWDFLQYTKKQVYPLSMYIGAANRKLDTIGRALANYSTVFHRDDWKQPMENYKYIYDMTEGVPVGLDFVQLAIIVGDRPLEESIEYISIAKEPLNSNITGCFMLTYGWQLKNLLKEVNVRIIEDQYCNLAQNTSVNITCFELLGGIMDGNPHGGEPIICNERLYAIVSGESYNFPRSDEYYACIAIYDHLEWIYEKMISHGKDARMLRLIAASGNSIIQIDVPLFYIFYIQYLLYT